MTEQIYIAAPVSLSLDAIAERLKGRFPVDRTLPWEVRVAEGNEYVRIEESRSVQNEFSSEVLAKTLAILKSAPKWFVLTHVGIMLLKKVITAFADDPSIVINNDVGVVLPGPAFIERIRQEPDWDWRVP